MYKKNRCLTNQTLVIFHYTIWSPGVGVCTGLSVWLFPLIRLSVGLLFSNCCLISSNSLMSWLTTWKLVKVMIGCYLIVRYEIIVSPIKCIFVITSLYCGSLPLTYAQRVWGRNELQTQQK